MSNKKKLQKQLIKLNVLAEGLKSQQIEMFQMALKVQTLIEDVTYKLAVIEK